MAIFDTHCHLNDDLLYKDNMEQAYKRLHKTNSFPEFTSRVCPALCEKACTCGLNGDPVSVRANEYSIIEKVYGNRHTLIHHYKDLSPKGEYIK